MRMQRDFLLSVTLAAATATAALGQTATPSAPPAGSLAQGSASIPDFSGIWAHLTWPDVEPPLAGPGPVQNTSRRNGVSDVYQLVGDHSNPILKPQAAQVVKKAGDVALGGATYPTPSNQCWPGGVPFIFWNIGMQMIQRPGEITLLYSNDHEVRHVRMNQPHPARLTPSWYGDSVGHYEGDTLVIDTVGVKIGPFAMVDMYGTPHSEALHVVERYRLLDYEAAKEAEERGERGNFRLPGSDPGLHGTPATRARACSSNSRSRMKASSPHLGQPPSFTSARFLRSADGRNPSAPTTPMNTTQGRTARCRPRTSRISKDVPSSQKRAASVPSAGANKPKFDFCT